MNIQLAKVTRAPLGMSLLELMIVLGISSITSVVIGQIFLNQLKSGRTLELRASARDLAEDITALLSSRASCEASLGGKAPNGPTPIDQIKVDPDGTPGGPNTVRYTTGQTYGSPPVTLTSITLKTDPTQGVPSLNPSQQGTALLQMDFTLGSTGAVMGGSVFSVTRRLRVTTSPSAPVVIQGCSSTESMGQNLSFSLFGSNNRCKNDDIILACSNHPGSPENYNYCINQTHGQYYGVVWRWSSVVGGYVVIYPSCTHATTDPHLCSAFSRTPFRIDALCAQGFE